MGYLLRFRGGTRCLLAEHFCHLLSDYADSIAFEADSQMFILDSITNAHLAAVGKQASMWIRSGRRYGKDSHRINDSRTE